MRGGPVRRVPRRLLREEEQRQRQGEQMALLRTDRATRYVDHRELEEEQRIAALVAVPPSPLQVVPYIAEQEVMQMQTFGPCGAGVLCEKIMRNE